MELLLAPEGEVVAEHPATLTYRVFSVLFLVLPGAALLALSTQLGPNDADARIPMIVFGILPLALGVLAILQQNKSKVVLRADGVERWGLRGKLWALRFAEMPQLHYRVMKVRLGGLLGLVLPALGTNYHLGFTEPSGKKRTIPANLKSMEILAERVVEQHTTSHFAAARKQIDAGEEVRFGKSVAVDREKLSVKKLFGGMKSCPLAEIEKFVVQNGALRVRQRGKLMNFASIYTAQIPNVFLLLKLLDSLLAQKTALGEDRDFAGQAYVG
ncbi:MAG: hypothetical protein LC689_01895 [Myxococcales bacterium]|nr:hypothetical protein [Myxococcales bacterium]